MEIIAPETAHVLYDDTLDPSCPNVGKHTLEARTVEVCAGITVILVIMAVSGNPVILAVAFQNLLLERDLSRINSPKQHLWTQYATKRYAMNFHLSTEHDFGGEHAILIGKRTCTTGFFCNMVD